MAYRTNLRPPTSVGDQASRPAVGVQDGQSYASEVGLSEWDQAANLWRGAGGTGIDTRYWVSNSASPPFTYFKSIQACNDAMVADGHGPANPAVMFVLPGTYVENVVLDDGISIYCFAMPDSIGNTVLQGSLHIHSAGIHTVCNMFISGAVVLGDGTPGVGSYTLESVTIIPTIAGQVPLTLNDPTSEFRFNNVSCDSTTSVANAIETLSPIVNLTAWISEILAPPTKKAILFGSTVTNFSFEDCEFASGVQYGAAVTSGVFSDCHFAMTAGNPVLTSFAGSSTVFAVCGSTGLATGDQFIAGSGAIEIDQFTSANPLTIAPTISGGVLETQRIYSQSGPVSGANIVLTAVSDLNLVGNGGVNFNCTLPSTKTMIQGIRAVLRNTGVSVMTLKADPATAGDTIDGVASVTVVPPSKSVCVQLNGQNWTTFANA